MESIKELRKVCQPKELGKEFFYIRKLRRISIYFTKAFLKIGVPANAVTAFQIVLLVTSILYFAFSYSWVNILISIVLFNISYLMDVVDGEIARYRGPTYYGRFLDVAGHDIAYFIHFFVGLGLYLRYDSMIYLIFGLSASLFTMMLRLHELRFEHMGIVPKKKSGRIAKFAYDITLINMFLPVLYILWIIDLHQYFVYFYGAYIPLFWLVWAARKHGQGGRDKSVKDEVRLWKDIREHA